MLAKAFSIIGTDTNIGKTYITCNLIRHLQGLSFKVFAQKPLATGKKNINDIYVNEDAYALYDAMNHSQFSMAALAQVNPICFTQATAPHIAALEEGYELSVANITSLSKHNFLHNNYDFILIEGIGGLMVPLNINETYIDLLKSWQYPIILVVGIKLGCLNHALLTYSKLKASNLKIAGWIANFIDENMLYAEQNVSYLKQALSCPLIASNYFASPLLPHHAFDSIFYSQIV